MNFIFWPFTALFAGAMFLVMIFLVVFWIWMLVDCSKRKFRNDTEKVIWILVIVFFQWLASLAYFIVIRANNPKGLMKKTKK